MACPEVETLNLGNWETSAADIFLDCHRKILSAVHSAKNLNCLLWWSDGGFGNFIKAAAGVDQSSSLKCLHLRCKSFKLDETDLVSFLLVCFYFAKRSISGGNETNLAEFDNHALLRNFVRKYCCFSIYFSKS